MTLRTMVVWVPDWPVMAALSEHSENAPVAALSGNYVLACSPAARADGIKRGMRRRDAQSRCPALICVPHRPEADAQAFEDVLSAIEELSPGVGVLRPGLCAVRVPASFYGGEAETAAIFAERLVSLGVWDVRFGVADGVFAAELAARSAAPQDVVIVPAGESAAFLAGFPVSALDAPDTTSLLKRLGIHTLGAFAALPYADVHTRFGRDGALLHRLAAGHDPHPVSRRQPPPELSGETQFEPPVSLIESLAFSLRALSEKVVAGLSDHGLVCTAVRIEACVDGRVVTSRRWVHPRWFSAVDIIDRVRWQLQADPAPGPIDVVRFIPDAVESIGEHAESLFSTGTDENVERGIARVQSMVGHDGVVAPLLQGGRSPLAKTGLSAWGEQSQQLRPLTQPWPGTIPPPAPTTVFRQPVAAQVVGGDNQVVEVDARGALNCEPRRFRAKENRPWQEIAAWAGPWPVDEQWWDEAGARRIARFQVVGVDGSAWLMVIENRCWWTEAQYD